MKGSAADAHWDDDRKCVKKERRSPNPAGLSDTRWESVKVPACTLLVPTYVIESALVRACEFHHWEQGLVRWKRLPRALGVWASIRLRPRPSRWFAEVRHRGAAWIGLGLNPSISPRRCAAGRRGSTARA